MDSLLKETKTVFETLTFTQKTEYQNKLFLLDKYIEELKRLRSNGRLIDSNLDNLVFNIFYKVKEASK